MTVGGIIEKVKKIFLKSQKSMAFVGLEDAGGQKMEAIVFPKTLEQYGGLLAGRKYRSRHRKNFRQRRNSEDHLLTKPGSSTRKRSKDITALEEQRKNEDEREKSMQKIFITLPPRLQVPNSCGKFPTFSTLPKPATAKIFLELVKVQGPRLGNAVSDKL